MLFSERSRCVKLLGSWGPHISTEQQLSRAIFLLRRVKLEVSVQFSMATSLLTSINYGLQLRRHFRAFRRLLLLQKNTIIMVRRSLSLKVLLYTRLFSFVLCADIGHCVFVYGLRLGEFCQRDSECETGLVCMHTGDTRSCQPAIASRKQYSE